MSKYNSKYAPNNKNKEIILKLLFKKKQNYIIIKIF